MARVSKQPLSPTEYRQLLDTLDIALEGLKKDEVRAFLFSLLGKDERVMVAKRFAAIILLKDGYRAKDIASSLKMTEATIRKLYMVLMIKGEGFNLGVKKVNQAKLKQEVKQALTGLAKETAKGVLMWRIKAPNDFPK